MRHPFTNYRADFRTSAKIINNNIDYGDIVVSTLTLGLEPIGYYLNRLIITWTAWIIFIWISIILQSFTH